MGSNISSLSPEQQAEAKRLWQDTELPASAIAARIGTTKNTILGLGLVHRRGWGNRADWRGPEPTTLFDRMDVLEANLNAVLAAYPPGYGVVKVSKVEPPPRIATRWPSPP
jgi:hypothetical protein